MSTRWETGGREASLPALRAFIAEVARDLDPGSRYVSELLAVVDAARDVDDYLLRLEDPERVGSFQRDGSQVSQGERGRSWVDVGTWGRMNPFERTLANLLTGETRMMWAGEGAADFNHLPEVLGRMAAPRQVLSVPCSTGKEAYSLVIAGLSGGLELSVVGVDRQAAYLERARSGVLVPHWRDLELDGVGAFLQWDEACACTRVSREVLERCSFALGDVLTGELPPGPFGLVACRNLLGYFRGEPLQAALGNVIGRVAPGGTLLLDPFVAGSPEMEPARAALSAAGFARRFPGASYYARS